MRPPTRTQAPTSFIRKWPRERRRMRGPSEIVKTFEVDALEHSVYESVVIFWEYGRSCLPCGYANRRQKGANRRRQPQIHTSGNLPPRHQDYKTHSPVSNCLTHSQ